MAEQLHHDRRGFLGTAALALAALRFRGAESSTQAMTIPHVSGVKPGTTSPPLGPVKQIDAGLLNVGYVDLGPANGRAVLLLHGWPYDIQSFAEVAPVLASKG